MSTSPSPTICVFCLQAVIFIFEHSQQGSAGLILNRPTQYTIGGLPGLETLCPEFVENNLFLVLSHAFFSSLPLMNHDAYVSCLVWPAEVGLCPAHVTLAYLHMYQGGDVSANSMHMLHSHSELPETVDIIKGICMGGFDAAKAAVGQGRYPASDFK
jgi:putative AlgH/UPF0301 family transcriptional regulator